MEKSREELEEKIESLKGEREAVKFGMVQLSLDSKVKMYLNLAEKEKELTKWIDSLELDLELDEMKHCRHAFVKDENRENALPHFAKFETMYYCVKCGLYGPCLNVKVTDPSRVKRISDIYFTTSSNGFRCDLSLTNLEEAKKTYKRFKDLMPEVEDERLVVYLGNYLEYLRRGIDVSLEAYKSLDEVYHEYSPYFITSYIDCNIDKVETKRLPRVYKK